MATINPIRIRLRYADFETFVEKFAANVTRGGVFLASRNIQAVGTIVPFEIQLIKGEIALAGQGRVTWIKEFNPAEPNRPYGMGVQFISIEPTTKPILARILRAKEAGIQRRATTGPLTPLDAGTAGRPQAAGQASAANGKRPAARVDTSVDLVAEYGLDEYAVRHIIERTWMTGARTSDDLADLLKPEPVESVTLAQALSELPRLLDPQYSRRRASGGFRGVDAAGETRGRVSEEGRITSETLSTTETARAAETTLADGGHTTDRSHVNGVETSEQLPMGIATDAEMDRPSDRGGQGDRGDQGGHASTGSALTTDLGDTTDMTGARDTAESIQAVPAEPVASSGGNGRPSRKRRR